MGSMAGAMWTNCAPVYLPDAVVCLKPNKTTLGASSKLAWRSGPQRLDVYSAARLGSESWKLASVQASSAVQEERSDEDVVSDSTALEFSGVHHVGLLCEDVERALEFYCGILGLEINPNRPNDKLPYRGAWLNVGPQMIHLMELPNPDPKTGRPNHGGRDRHACVAIKDVSKLKAVLDKAGIPYTSSMSGRPAVFARDPDSNALEFAQG